MTQVNFNINDVFDVNSKQNNRILIIGGSGSGKTTMTYNLIFNHLPKYRRHIIIAGAEDNLKNTLKNVFTDNGVKVYDKIITSPNEIDIDLPSKIGLQDLLIIDDLSHMMSKSANKITEFITNCFTTSRHRGFDIICITHKLKMSNPIVRQNATKIIFTSLDKEILEEYKDTIINDKMMPIVINVLQANQQERLDDKDLPKMMSRKDYAQRIRVTQNVHIPQFTRQKIPTKFIKVNANDETYQYEITPNIQKMVNRMNMKSGRLTFENGDPFSKENEVVEQIVNNRDIVNTGEMLAGNDNINITPTIKKLKKGVPGKRR